VQNGAWDRYLQIRLDLPTIDRKLTEPSPTRYDAAIVAVCTLGYAALGWVLNGLGAVLPSLRDDVGDIAGIYPLVPGLAALTTAIVVARHQRRAAPAGGVGTVSWAMGALAVALLAMGLTRWPALSVLATVAMAFAAARLGRALPGVLASLPRRDTNQLLMRTNGYSSVAGVVAPLSVGATVAVGLGWLAGYAGPVFICAVAVIVLVRRLSATVPDPTVPPDPDLTTTTGSVPITTLAPRGRSSAWQLTMLLMTLAIVVEFCFTYFAATYLSEELDLSNAAAAAGGAAWGIGMAAGRLTARGGRRAASIRPSLGVIAVGFAVMWLTASPLLAIAGFLIAGVGAAPLYPNLMTTLMERFPGPANQAATYGLMSSGIALVSAPALMVAVRAVSDVRTAYLLVPVLLMVLAAASALDRSPTPAALP
jgi:MFS family permease